MIFLIIYILSFTFDLSFAIKNSKISSRHLISNHPSNQLQLKGLFGSELCAEYNFLNLAFAIISRKPPHDEAVMAEDFQHQMERNLNFCQRNGTLNLQWNKIRDLENVESYEEMLIVLQARLDQTFATPRLSPSDVETRALRNLATNVVNLRNRKLKIRQNEREVYIYKLWRSIEDMVIQFKEAKYPTENKIKHFYIRIYEHPFFKGEHLEMNLEDNKCYALHSEEWWWDRVSSIDTVDSCIIIYDLSDCTGEYRVLTPGTSQHKNLKEISFNNIMRSIQGC